MSANTHISQLNAFPSSQDTGIANPGIKARVQSNVQEPRRLSFSTKVKADDLIRFCCWQQHPSEHLEMIAEARHAFLGGMYPASFWLQRQDGVLQAPESTSNSAWLGLWMAFVLESKPDEWLIAEKHLSFLEEVNKIPATSVPLMPKMCLGIIQGLNLEAKTVEIVDKRWACSHFKKLYLCMNAP